MKFKTLFLVTSISASLATSFNAAAQQSDEDTQIPVRPVNSERLPNQATPAAYRGADDLRGAINQQQGQGQIVDGYGRPVTQAPSQPAKPAEPTFIEKVKKRYTPEQEYDLKPGRNIVVPVGQGFNNAIRTNFKSLSVKTSASADSAVLQVEDGNLYATLRTMQPISLLLSEDGVLESEISIVLVPVTAPPAMVDINIEMTPQMIAKASEYQAELEKERELQKALNDNSYERQNRNSTHANNLIAILKPIAQGSTPRGFSMTNDVPEGLKKPCRVSIYQQAGQRLTGAKEVVDVVLLQNDSNRVYQVREEMCLSDGALSVALYPRSYLQPGEETEAYIIRDKYHEPAEQRVTRPRLTRGGE